MSGCRYDIGGCETPRPFAFAYLFPPGTSLFNVKDAPPAEEANEAQEGV